MLRGCRQREALLDLFERRAVLEHAAQVRGAFRERKRRGHLLQSRAAVEQAVGANRVLGNKYARRVLEACHSLKPIVHVVCPHIIAHGNSPHRRAHAAPVPRALAFPPPMQVVDRLTSQARNRQRAVDAERPAGKRWVGVALIGSRRQRAAVHRPLAVESRGLAHGLREVERLEAVLVRAPAGEAVPAAQRRTDVGHHAVRVSERRRARGPRAVYVYQLVRDLEHAAVGRVGDEHAVLASPVEVQHGWIAAAVVEGDERGAAIDRNEERPSVLSCVAIHHGFGREAEIVGQHGQSVAAIEDLRHVANSLRYAESLGERRKIAAVFEHVCAIVYVDR